MYQEMKTFYFVSIGWNVSRGHPYFLKKGSWEIKFLPEYIITPNKIQILFFFKKERESKYQINN